VCESERDRSPAIFGGGVGGGSRSRQFRPWQGCQISARFPKRHRERYDCERQKKKCRKTNPRRKKEIPAANQRRQPARAPRAGITAVISNVGSGLSKTAEFRLISGREAELGRV